MTWMLKLLMKMQQNKQERENGAAAAKSILEVIEEVSIEDVEIRRFIGERKNTAKGEKQRLKELSKQIRKGHIVFHTEHVEHDMNDDTGERTNTMHNTTNAKGEQTEIVIENEKAEAEAEGVEGMSTETMLNDAVETAGGTGEEHSERNTVNKESGHIVGEEHHARCTHSDEEAGSFVLHRASHARSTHVQGKSSAVEPVNPFPSLLTTSLTRSHFASLSRLTV